jgi:aminopeptidase N
MHDLFQSWARAGAGDLTDFVQAWLRTAGPDRIAWDGSTITRTPPPAHPADRSHTFRLAVHEQGAWRTETVTVRDATPFRADGAVVLDPYDDTWAAVVPDPATVQALKTLAPAIRDEGLRAGVWTNLKTGLHNALVDPADVVDIAVAALPVEDPDLSPRRTLAWLMGMVLPLAPRGSSERIHAAALAALAREEPGSERQLGALRYAVATSADAGELRGWLTAPPEGIALDPVLRWGLLARLADLGQVTREELQEVYDAAPTADAKVALVRCLASLPDAEAKDYAWSLFTGATPASNYELEAAGEGMWQGGQEHLTAGYVDRYFTDLPGTSTIRSGWSLADSAASFFPVTSLTQDTLDRAQAMADDASLDAPLRRRLSDTADQLRRRLAIRAAFPH